MGSDSFQNLPRWKNFDLLVKNYSFIIYLRKEFEVKDDYGAKVQILDAPMLEISATEIRDNIQNGRTIRYLVPDKVRDEIEQNRYYK
jgi:nicotinate-nucleotide adenylyltransferase